jgi:hypothetical protein
MAIAMQDVHVNVVATSPEKIKAILLEDGWHEVSGCELVQFAVAEAMSPPAPQRLYPALRYTGRGRGRGIITPLRQVLAFEAR